MRLLMVTPNFPPTIGGVQNYAEALALAFHTKTERFGVLAERHADGAQRDKRYAFEVRRLPDPGDNFALSAALPLKLWLAQEPFDAIFATHWSAAFCARLATRGNLPIGCAVHGKEVHIDPLRRLPAIRRGYRYARKSALRHSLLFPVSTYTAESVRRHFPEHGQIQVVNNGVDLAVYHPTPQSERRARTNAPVFLTVGRLVERKGVDNVLRALAGLSDQPFEYWVVGEGPAQDSLQALAAELGISEQVTFWGSVPHEELLAFYNDCDVFVMTPRDVDGDVEGFGLVFLEAAACGKPVIGSRSGGVPDAVRHGQNGYLVKPEAPQELRARFEELLKSQSLRKRLGEHSLKHARACSWENAAGQIVAALEHACSNA